MEFEWDPAKAALNVAKHGVSFNEAASVFGDPLSMVFEDPDHSGDESRVLMVGMSDDRRLLIISFLEIGDIIRIISARETTRAEREKYENG